MENIERGGFQVGKRWPRLQQEGGLSSSSLTDPLHLSYKELFPRSLWGDWKLWCCTWLGTWVGSVLWWASKKCQLEELNISQFPLPLHSLHLQVNLFLNMINFCVTRYSSEIIAGTSSSLQGCKALPLTAGIKIQPLPTWSSLQNTHLQHNQKACGLPEFYPGSVKLPSFMV